MNFRILTLAAVIGCTPAVASAQTLSPDGHAERSCTVTMINENIVRDIVMHEDKADLKMFCYSKCQEFASEKIEPLSDKYSKLIWTCEFDDEAFYSYDVINREDVMEYQ